MMNSTPTTLPDNFVAASRKVADSTPAEVMQRLASGAARELRHDRDRLVDALVFMAQDLTTSEDVELAARGVSTIARVVSSLEVQADAMDELTSSAEGFQTIAAATVARATQES